MNSSENYVVPMLLSEYVKTLEDWEIIEWLSRFDATSKYMRNGATHAKHEEMTKVWSRRYPDEDVPLLECVPPLDSELYFISSCTDFKNNIDNEIKKDE